MSEKDIKKKQYSEEEQTEIEDLETLMEDEGDPKYTFLGSLFKRSQNINFITELSKSQIRAMSIVEVAEGMIKEEFEVDIDVKHLTREIKEEMVSHKRKGREEAIKPLIADEEMGKKRDILKVLGMRT